MSSLPNPRVHRSDIPFTLLRDLVHERTGLFFEDAKSDIFLDKLSPAIDARATGSALDYYHLLKYDSESTDEWNTVIDALTVHESYFWREMDHIHTLVEHIVPQYFRDYPGQPLNIWSAACAAGEEPLTIAMQLDQAGWFERETIDIYASDASPRAVEMARKGVYRERSFRSLPAQLRRQYFTQTDNDSQELCLASEKLQSRVRWGVANLVSEADVAPVATTAPIVFCRNVFIYFSEDATRKTVRMLSELMPNPAYLFVGAAESLLRIGSDFDLKEIGDAFVYRRNGGGTT